MTNTIVRIKELPSEFDFVDAIINVDNDGFVYINGKSRSMVVPQGSIVYIDTTKVEK